MRLWCAPWSCFVAMLMAALKELSEYRLKFQVHVCTGFLISLTICPQKSQEPAWTARKFVRLWKTGTLSRPSRGQGVDGQGHVAKGQEAALRKSKHATGNTGSFEGRWQSAHRSLAAGVATEGASAALGHFRSLPGTSLPSAAFPLPTAKPGGAPLSGSPLRTRRTQYLASQRSCYVSQLSPQLTITQASEAQALSTQHPKHGGPNCG